MEQEIGIGIGSGALLAVVAREVLTFLKDKKSTLSKKESANDCAKCIEKINLIGEHVQDLLNMHNVKDNDGTPIWYVPRSWAETQKNISDSQQQIVMSLQSISGTQKSIAKTLERMEANK